MSPGAAAFWCYSGAAQLASGARRRSLYLGPFPARPWLAVPRRAGGWHHAGRAVDPYPASGQPESRRQIPASQRPGSWCRSGMPGTPPRRSWSHRSTTSSPKALMDAASSVRLQPHADPARDFGPARVRKKRISWVGTGDRHDARHHRHPPRPPSAGRPHSGNRRSALKKYCDAGVRPCLHLGGEGLQVGHRRLACGWVSGYAATFDVELPPVSARMKATRSLA